MKLFTATILLLLTTYSLYSQQNYRLILGRENDHFVCDIEGIREGRIQKHPNVLNQKDTILCAIYLSPNSYDFFSEKYRISSGDNFVDSAYKLIHTRSGEPIFEQPISIITEQKLEVIQVNYLHCQNVSFSIPEDRRFFVSGLEADKATISLSRNNEVSIAGKVKLLTITALDNPTSLYFDSIKVQKAVLNNNITLHGNNNLPDTLIFSDNQKMPVDLSQFSLGNNSTHYIFTKQLKNWNINYKYFDILTSDSSDTKRTINEDQLYGLYSDILEIQKKYGYESGYEKADKAFIQLKYKSQGWWGSFLNWLNHNWWDYSYGKHLIFRNSFILFLIAFIGNLLVFGKIVTETYKLDKVHEAYEASKKKFRTKPIKRSLRNSAYCLLFTCYIFWGWKLEFDKLKVEHLRLAFWVILQYLVGIVCLAYLAGYIISK
ncbi:MAG: hypothetical protein QM802_02975 [Agriterribacter sp.]